MEFCFPSVYIQDNKQDPGSSCPRVVLDGAFSYVANINCEELKLGKDAKLLPAHTWLQKGQIHNQLLCDF